MIRSVQVHDRYTSLTGERRERLVDAEDFLFPQNALEPSHGCSLLAVLDDTQELFLTTLVMPNGRNGATHTSPDTLCPVAA